MIVFILSFVLLIVIVAIMSIGVMMGRKPIAGSCGGLKAFGDGTECEICGGDPNRCESEQDNLDREPLSDADFYDAQASSNEQS